MNLCFIIDENGGILKYWTDFDTSQEMKPCGNYLEQHSVKKRLLLGAEIGRKFFNTKSQEITVEQLISNDLKFPRSALKELPLLRNIPRCRTVGCHEQSLPKNSNYAQ